MNTKHKVFDGEGRGFWVGLKVGFWVLSGLLGGDPLGMPNCQQRPVATYNIHYLSCLLICLSNSNK